MVWKLHARRFATLALAVLVWAALAPTISRVWLAFNADAMAMGAVCSATDPSMPASPGQSAPMTGLDCPMCLLQAQGQAPGPEVSVSKLVLQHLSDAMPPLFLRAPRPLFAWASAQPRAPPLAA